MINKKGLKLNLIKIKQIIRKYRKIMFKKRRKTALLFKKELYSFWKIRMKRLAKFNKQNENSLNKMYKNNAHLNQK
jgi:flavorubredoxin